MSRPQDKSMTTVGGGRVPAINMGIKMKQPPKNTAGQFTVPKGSIYKDEVRRS